VKFKLIESFSGIHKTENLSAADAKDLLQTSFSHAVKATPIYRGVEMTNKYPVLLKPDPKLLRISANASYNFYTMIINNSKTWAKFPKRQIICSTSKQYTKTYGNIFRVYPHNRAKIGICPKKDIWDSYFNGNNNNLATLFNNFNIDPNKINTWESLIRACSKIDKIKMKILKSETSMGEYFQDIYFSDYPWQKFISSKLSLLDYLATIVYSPKKFEVRPIEDFKNITGAKEVWIDVPCLLIGLEKNDKWSDEDEI